MRRATGAGGAAFVVVTAVAVGVVTAAAGGGIVLPKLPGQQREVAPVHVAVAV